MKLIIGLGNVGLRYANTRHNVGFMVVDSLAGKHEADFRENKYLHASAAKYVTAGGEKIVLMKPSTLMNHSGLAVSAGLERFAPENGIGDILVVFDDFALDFGYAKFKPKGGTGGHNGIDSIIAHLGTQDFARLKVGIRNAMPVRSEQMPDFVLSDFARGEKELLKKEIVPELAQTVEEYIDFGFEKAANKINGKCLYKEGQ